MLAEIGKPRFAGRKQAFILRMHLKAPDRPARPVPAMLIFASFNVLWAPLVLPLAAPPFSLSHTEIGLFGLAGVALIMAGCQAVAVVCETIHRLRHPTAKRLTLSER
ncbi:hypothetical protein [Mesorhizobium humile]|uniref:hypothetical protein n=1 Tax=Mesorhizobium humile TaxID=3072313 RepID=UPI003D31F416